MAIKARCVELNMDLFQGTLEPGQKILEDGDLSKRDVNGIVLVGGSTRNPKVCVAAQTDVLSGEKDTREIVPLDVNTLTLQIEIGEYSEKLTVEEKADIEEKVEEALEGKCEKHYMHKMHKKYKITIINEDVVNKDVTMNMIGDSGGGATDSGRGVDKHCVELWFSYSVASGGGDDDETNASVKNVEEHAPDYKNKYLEEFWDEKNDTMVAGYGSLMDYDEDDEEDREGINDEREQVTGSFVG